MKIKTTIQPLWDSAKIVLTRKYIAIQAYSKKQEKSQIQKSKSTLKGTRSRTTKTPQTQKKRNNKDQRRNKQYRIQKTEQINEIKSWFFEKINKIGKFLARLPKKRIQIGKIKKENAFITTNPSNTSNYQRIL